MAMTDDQKRKHVDGYAVPNVPCVSVLMPVFNAERYVEAAVRSVLDQTFRNFEFLIIDDGSTDASLAILKRLAALDSRIFVTSRPNAGIVATRNELLFMSRGKLVALMDADDECAPERFAQQVNYLQENPQIVGLGTRVVFIDPEGSRLMEAMNHLVHEEIDAELLRPGLGMVNPSVMARADACKLIGGYRPEYEYAEDLDFFLRLAEFGKLANLPTPLLQYRLHSSSVSHRFVVEQSRSAARAVQDALRRRGNEVAVSKEFPILLSTLETKAQLHRKWAWWALGARNFRTARKHAVRAVLAEPLNLNNIKVLICALRDTLRNKSFL